MWDYKQPSFYRFNEDSIHLAKWALSQVGDMKLEIIADLCAGCGVVGLEFIQEYCKPLHLTFCEYQDDFIPFLKENIAFIKKGVEFQSEVRHGTYQSLGAPTRPFDLILCNPPYFMNGSGRQALDIRRQKCREQIDFSWDSFFKKCVSSLTSKGHLIFSHRQENEGEFWPASFQLEGHRVLNGCHLVHLSLINK